MKVILQQRVQRLGQIGDIVSVRPGFARNYLVPQGHALYATPNNLKSFAHRRAQLEASNLTARKESEDLIPRLKDVWIHLVRPASDLGHLYGSIRSTDIAKALTAHGVTVHARQIRLSQPLKEIGVQSITLALHPEVTTEIMITVGRNSDEIDLLTEAFHKAQARPKDPDASPEPLTTDSPPSQTSPADPSESVASADDHVSPHTQDAES